VKINLKRDFYIFLLFELWIFSGGRTKRYSEAEIGFLKDLSAALVEERDKMRNRSLNNSLNFYDNFLVEENEDARSISSQNSCYESAREALV